MSVPPPLLPEAFTPFTFDASNLQKFLLGVLKKVESCERENATLNQELSNLKVAQRLDMLEQSVQELADLQMPDSGYGCSAPKSQTPPQQTQPEQTRPQQAQPPVQTPPQQVQPPVQTPPQQVQPPVQTPPQQVQPPVQTPPQQAQPPVQTPPHQAQPPVQTPPQQAQPPVQTPPQQVQPPVQTPPQQAQPPLQTPPQQAQPVPAAAAHWLQGQGADASDGVPALHQEVQARADAITVMHGAYASERPPAAALSDDGAPRGGRPGTAQWEGAGAGVLLAELRSVQGRMSQMERKAEALWHVQECDQEVRGVVQRLKQDVDAEHSDAAELRGSVQFTQGALARLESTVSETNGRLAELQGEVGAVTAQLARAAAERRELAAKLEGGMQRVWDDIRVVDSSMNERLAQGEAAAASLLRSLEQRGEQGEEVRERVEEVRWHVGALQHKLESFDTRVAAALSPLHSSLGDVKQRMEELSQRKQDAATAVTLNDVNVAAARTMDHADRRSDNTIKSIGALEARVEALHCAKAAKADVVMTSDLQSLLTAHAVELDAHLDALKAEILGTVGLKAERGEVLELEAKLGPRISGLESSILKGLRGVGDRASQALANKLDLSSFVDFQSHVRVVLLDLEQRLKDWSPMARGVKSSADDSSGGGQAVSCLCCASKVRSAKEMQSLGFSSTDKVFSPERLPHMCGLLPSIQRSPDVAAHSSAGVLRSRKSLLSLLNRGSSTSIGVTEPLPEASGSVDRVLTGSTSLGSFDPTALLGVDFKTRLSKRSLSMKVEVETISATGASPKTSSKDLALQGSPQCQRKGQLGAAT